MFLLLSHLFATITAIINANYSSPLLHIFSTGSWSDPKSTSILTWKAYIGEISKQPWQLPMLTLNIQMITDSDL